MTTQPRNTSTPATFARLRDGSWGARVTGPVAVGDVLAVRARSGRVQHAAVAAIVWQGRDGDDAVALCATKPIDAPKANPERAPARDLDNEIRDLREQVDALVLRGLGHGRGTRRDYLTLTEVRRVLDEHLEGEVFHGEVVDTPKPPPSSPPPPRAVIVAEAGEVDDLPF